MVKAIMHGCNGHMGRVITDIIKNTEGIELVAGIDKYTKVPNEYPVFERSQVRQKRDGKEIGISAVRGGTIVGDHEVLFAGQDEVIEFKHTAYSKAVFGKGAVEAAKFLAGKPAGRYDMSDVIQF